MSASITMEDMLGSLTGHDEDLIYSRFNIDIYSGMEARPMLGVRALIFIHRIREGDKPSVAKDHANSLTLTDVQAYFAEDDADETAGNGDGEPSSEPKSSPSS